MSSANTSVSPLGASATTTASTPSTDISSTSSAATLPPTQNAQAESKHIKGLAIKLPRKSCTVSPNSIDINTHKNIQHTSAQSRGKKRKMDVEYDDASDAGENIEHDSYAEIERAEVKMAKRHRPTKKVRLSSNEDSNSASKKPQATEVSISPPRKRKRSDDQEVAEEIRQPPAKQLRLTGVGEDDESDDEDMPTTRGPQRRGRKAKPIVEKRLNTPFQQQASMPKEVIKRLPSKPSQVNTAVAVSASAGRKNAQLRSHHRANQIPGPKPAAKETLPSSTQIDRNLRYYKGEAIPTNDEVKFAVRMGRLRAEDISNGPLRCDILWKWAEIHHIDFDRTSKQSLWKHIDDFVKLRGDQLDPFYGFKVPSTAQMPRIPKKIPAQASKDKQVPTNSSRHVNPAPSIPAPPIESMIKVLSQKGRYDSNKFTKRQKLRFIKEHIPSDEEEEVDLHTANRDLDLILQAWYKDVWLRRRGEESKPLQTKDANRAVGRGQLYRGDSYRPGEREKTMSRRQQDGDCDRALLDSYRPSRESWR